VVFRLLAIDVGWSSVTATTLTRPYYRAHGPSSTFRPPICHSHSRRARSTRFLASWPPYSWFRSLFSPPTLSICFERGTPTSLHETTLSAKTEVALLRHPRHPIRVVPLHRHRGHCKRFQVYQHRLVIAAHREGPAFLIAPFWLEKLSFISLWTISTSSSRIVSTSQKTKNAHH
jgi:hypothetical protein